MLKEKAGHKFHKQDISLEDDAVQELGHTPIDMKDLEGMMGVAGSALSEEEMERKMAEWDSKIVVTDNLDTFSHDQEE